MAWPEVLAAGRPDVVHGHAEAEVGLVRSGVLAACAVPVTATLYGSPLAGVLDHLRIGRRPGSGWRGVWRALCGAAGVGPTFGRRRDYRRRRVIVLSRRQAQLVRWSYGPRTAEVIYPGIDVEVYTPADGAARVAARRRFGLPAGAFVWAFVGRLGYGKGADVTLRALAAAGRPEDRLLVVGEGPEEPGLRALARTVGCADRVHFAGPLSAPLAAYQAADALLFPTRHEESFGLVVAEAMACGLPVVASRRGAVGEVIGRAGLVLPPDDVRTWSAAMRRLATDEPGRAELARAARRRAVRHLGHELTVQQLERRYVALAAGRATT
jgi:glycosyltransferase involved in cell wall biosynthesis